MATAQTILFFGVFVKSCSLCFASDAFKATKGTLLAIDIIQDRRRTDRLDKTALSRIPEEVWQLVKEQVIDQALFKAEQDLHECYCVQCPCLSDPWEPFKIWTRQDCEDIDEFWEMFLENEGTRGMVDRRLTDIMSLLNSFGLSLPTKELYNVAQHECDDFDALSAISLPLYSTSAAAPSTSSSASKSRIPSFSHSDAVTVYETFDTPSLVQISPHAFTHSVANAPRLKRFLSLFNLCVENPSAPTFHPTPARALPSIKDSEPKDAQESGGKSTASESRKDERKEEDKKQREKETEQERQLHASVCCENSCVEPHWQMMTILKVDY